MIAEQGRVFAATGGPPSHPNNCTSQRHPKAWTASTTAQKIGKAPNSFADVGTATSTSTRQSPNSKVNSLDPARTRMPPNGHRPGGQQPSSDPPPEPSSLLRGYKRQPSRATGRDSLLAARGVRRHASTW